MGERLFERHFEAIYRFFGNKVEPADVGDLVQQTFLACVESVESFQGKSSLRTFLFAIARHRLYHHYRARQRAPTVDFGVSSVIDLAPSPSSMVARAEQQRMLTEGLRRIPLELQIALELRYVEGLRGPELARVLEVPEGTVRSRLRRAIDALRAQMDGLPAPDEERRQALSELDGWWREAAGAAG